MLVAEDRADHIDLNFGCPVPKVTRKGGGAALPWKQDLFSSIVNAAVKAAGEIPLTIKMRKGIDSDHLTYLDAAKTARDAGVAAIALHARTTSEYYSGHADWSAIGKLRETITDIPVLGNGDIWSAADAIRMVRETGVDGVVVGRGCLGRPWLFFWLIPYPNRRLIWPNFRSPLVWDFFAISGYLVGGPWVRAALGLAPAPRVGRYAARRLRRIVPAFWVVLAAAARLLGRLGCCAGESASRRVRACENCTGWRMWRTQ